MKLAVVGCGAVGSYYGSRLIRGGHEGHFILRSDFNVVSKKGIRVCSPDGDYEVAPHCHRTPDSVGSVDLLLIALKSTANSHLDSVLPSLVHPNTTLLTLQNGLGNVEKLTSLFPRNPVYGGLCFVCLNRVEPGVIHHIAHGRIVMGKATGGLDDGIKNLASLMTDCGLEIQLAEDFKKALWEKLLWNIPFNGLGVASLAGLEAVRSGQWDGRIEKKPCMTTDQLLADPLWLKTVRDLMDEVRTAASALGVTIPDSLPEQMIAKTREMGPYKASTLLDYEMGKPLEVEAIFSIPLDHARKAGYDPGLLKNLVDILKKLNHERINN